MTEATEATVRGDFSGVVFEGDGMKARFFREGRKFLIETDGPDEKPGAPQDGGAEVFEVAYTFGWEPLQQYLIRFPGRADAGVLGGLGRPGEAVVLPLPRQEDPAVRLAPLDAQQPELERHVRRVPLHEPREGVRPEDRTPTTPRGPRWT